MSTNLQDSPMTEQPVRTPITRSVLMCKPDYFTVVYRINPWMNPALPTDTSLARFTVGAILEFGWGHGHHCAG